MMSPIRTFFATLSLLLCATSGSSAQESAAQAPEPPLAAAEAAPPVAAPADVNHAKRVLLQLTERERSARYASAYSMFIGGATAITAGLVADLVYDRGYGRVVWILGAVAGLGGVTNLLVAHPFERMARDAETWSPTQLQNEWARRALVARTARHVGGYVGLGLGALLVGGGAAIAAGLGDMERETKQNWTTALIAFGGVAMGGGLTSLLVESPFESSYRMAFGTDPKESAPVALRIAPTLGGAALSLRASF